MKKTALIFFFILQAFNALSQDGYKFRTLSPEGGFYFDGVKQIQQDMDGFVWILMDHDLYRFDGYQYKRYHAYFTNLDKSVEWIFKGLTITPSGYFLVSTNNGVYNYDKKLDTFEKIYDEVELMKIDNKENIWIRKERTWSMIDKGRSLVDISDSTLRTPLYDGQKGSFIGPVFCTSNNDLYTFSHYYRVFRYNYVKNEFSLCFNIPEEIGRLVTAKAYKGKLWALSHKHGLYKIDLSTFAIQDHFDFFKDSETRTLHVDKKGHIWIGTMKGLYVLDPDTRKFHHYVHSKSDPFSLPNNSVWTINEDNQQNIWIGTYSGAVAYVNLDEKRPFETYMPHDRKLSHTPVSAFAEDANSLWIGTEGGGINRLNKKTGEFSYYTNSKSKNSLAFDNIKSILVDKDQNLWIALFNGGLDYFNEKSGQFHNFKYTAGSNSVLDNSLRKIVLESDSGLWIAYQRKKVEISFYSFKSKQFRHYSPVEKHNQYIFDMLKGRENQLWILSNESLYWMDTKTNVIREIKRPDSVFLNFSTFCLDDSGNLWIGTIKNGLVKYDVNADKFILFDKILNYNVSSIYNISYDGEDNLWMGTDNGLFRYDILKDTFSEYDKGDGTQGQVYYPLASMKSMNGKLYFGGTNGFTVVTPEEVSLNKHKPKVIISDFYIDHQPSKLNFSSKDSIYEVVLTHNQANFGFKFSSDNFFLPEKNHFKYRLKNYDNRWIEVDASSRTAMYSKVPAGTYYFEVLASNNDGVWSESPTVIKIIRKPAPWVSWPAYILYAFSILGILFLIIRYYNEKKNLKMRLYLDNIEKEKKEEMHQSQLRFFTNISHDFRTPLSLIMASLDRLREDGIKEYYYRILNSNTQRLLNLVNELMDFRTIESGKMNLEIQLLDLNNFLDVIASDFSDYAKQRNIDFKVVCDPALPASLYADKKIVEKIVMNLLNNAFKYSKEGSSVSLETYFDLNSFKSQYESSYTVRSDEAAGKYFAIVVRDTGVGISKESISSVFERFYKVKTVNAGSHLGTGIGLALVKSLVLLHKGIISILSERGKGTDMLVCLPLDMKLYKEADFLKEEVKINDLAIKEKEEVSEILDETILLCDKKKVLIAEDNEDLRSLIADSLSADYEIIEAPDGLTASKLINSMDPDLIVSDIMMPFKDGVTLCHEIKNDINTSHIPFILLTAKTSLESKIEGVDSGADMYFEKPIDLNFLRISVNNIFKYQQQLKEYYAKNYFADSAELSLNEQDNKFLKKFIDIIEANIDQSEMDVNYIATQLSISRSKLYTKIKTLTDKSIVEFILNYRLRKAARLIIEEDMTMREIMAQIGIESQPYFTNAFKKEFGQTPTAFAMKHKKRKK